MNWDEFSDTTPSIDPETIKAKLPIEWVITVQAGINMEQRGDKLVGLCPFHDDVENPSLDIYEGGERWGCRVDGKGGDVLDFIKEFWGLTEFKDQMLEANRLLRHLEGQDWSPTEGMDEAEEYTADLSELWEESVLASQRIHMDNTPLAELLEYKGLEIDAQWLTDKWVLGVDGVGRLLAPYLNLGDTFVSYKLRTPGLGWMAAKGAELSILYGTNQLEHVDIDQPVWILEGETDTWLASWLLGDRGVALGLPTGAGSHPRPEWLDLLKGRRVTLMFDNDDAGRKAALRWHTALRPYARSILIAWPDGLDLCASSNPTEALWSGETVSDAMGNVVKHQGGYHLVNKDGEIGKQLSNWTMTPRKRIDVIDINGEVVSNGLEVVFDDRPGNPIRVNDDVWQQQSKMLKFVNLNGKAWLGSGSTNSQALFTELVAHTPFLGRERGVMLVGLHDPYGRPVFILPNDVIGSPTATEGWTYAAPDEGKVNFDQYKLKSDLDRPAMSLWGEPVVRQLMELSSTAIITPVIAWMCAAIGRSLFDEFPPLGVFGGSGTGKTTLVREVMRTLWGLNEEHNLSSTTPFGIRSMVAGTNALPLWFDEYRYGARKDALEMMNQTLRDAWSASASSRGGIGDNMQRLHTTRVIAPIVVSGEESLEERSHIDRVVAISLSNDDKRPESLAALQATRGDGAGRIGYTYIDWFIYQLTIDQLYIPAPEHDRQDQADSVLRWGWGLWVRFCQDAFGVKVNAEALDLTRVQQSRDATHESPIMDALIEALDNTVTSLQDDNIIAWTSPAGEGTASITYVRVHHLTEWAKRNGYILPGGTRSTKDWLINRFGGTNARVRGPGVGAMGQPVEAASSNALNVVKLVGMIEQIEADKEDEETT